MKVMFWVPPWPVNGDPNFFRNSFVKHLCQQANSLVGFAEKVTVVIPAHFEPSAAVLNSSIEVISLPLELTRTEPPLSEQIYQRLYTKPNGPETAHLRAQLAKYLPQKADTILHWESPVPYLETLYPEALIINQMPGTFSRPPYPHTVTFDPIGLYRDGMLHLHADTIQMGHMVSNKDRALASDFSFQSRRAMHCFNHLAEEVLARHSGFNDFALLPLQSSKHYAFAPDSGFDNQLDMLWSVLDRTRSSTGVLATQYRNGLVADTPLDQQVADSISNQFPNLIYNPKLENIESVSQYFLAHIDTIFSASSSLGLQGMVWNKHLHVMGQTFLEKYATDNPAMVGTEWESRCANTIATVLSRHQPLAECVTNDGHFLINLLEEMHCRKRGGAEGLDILPNFRSIDPDYDNKLMAAFRINRSARSLAVSVGKDVEAETLLRLQTLINEHDTKAFSFDVFDTLIRRSVEKPADLYRFMDKTALDLTDGVAADFGRVRSICEVETRSRLQHQKEEITLDDIYDTIASYYGLAPSDLSDLKQAEIELEVSHCRIRPFGRTLLDYVKQTGMPIYLISDMYLSGSVIDRMLAKTGYDGSYTNLFVSADHGCTKHSGKLYRIVLDQTELRPAELVHIGDNKCTDIEMAKAQKIRAFRWSSSIDWLRSNPVFKDIYSPRIGSGEKARSAIAGTTAAGLFDRPLDRSNFSSISGGDPFRLGFAVLGPLITGYMTWLQKEVLRDGVTDLFFMAREGWILKQVFDKLAQDAGGAPKTHYLLGSRRAIRVAACRTSADVMALLAMPYDPGVPLNRLLEGRFGLTVSGRDVDRLIHAGAPRANIALERSFEMRQILCAVVQAFMPDILENASMERDAYMGFLSSTGFLDAKTPGIVDVGWKTNIQGALGDLTNRRTTGYYYATLQDSEIWLARGDRHRAYVGTGQSAPLSKSVAIQNRHMVEFLLCSGARSLVSVSEEAGQHLPIYRAEADAAKRKALINALHCGAIEYARSFTNGFGDHLDEIVIDPNLAEAALASLLLKPQKADAALFLGQSFEDAVGGIAQRFVISPDRKASAGASVWRNGTAAVHGVGKTKPTKKAVPTPRGSSPADENPVLERMLIKGLLSDRKQAKYLRDREMFFQDARNPLVRLYGSTVGRRPT